MAQGNNVNITNKHNVKDIYIYIYALKFDGKLKRTVQGNIKTSVYSVDRRSTAFHFLRNTA